MKKVWHESYPPGVATEIDFGNYKAITDVFDEACQKFRSRVALINMGHEVTYEQYDILVGRFASFLQHELLLKKGDRIAIQMPNLIQFPIAIFGALRAGLVVVNTNPLYTPREMKHQFKDSGVKAVVILSNFAKHLEEILPETAIEHVIVTDIGDALPVPKKWIVNAVVKYVKKMVPSYHLPQAYSFNQALHIGAQKPYMPVKCSFDDIAFLQYTGGTTGVSKGAMLTQKNILANMLQMVAWMKPKLVEAEEIVVTPLPLYHIFSLTLNGLAFVKFGATNILITNPRDIPTFLKDIKKYKITCMSVVNTLLNGLLHHPKFSRDYFASLKITVAGGMALQTAVAAKWREMTGTPVIEGYGLTETSPVACCNPIDGTDKPGTIGVPLPSTDVKVIGEDGRDLPQGETGELCIKGPQVMKGYWQNPKETALVLTGDGWFKSGDIAMVDAQGFFKIVDRKKDMILVSGFNVYPNEVEDIIAGHPGVLEVAAIGVNDPKSGEVVKVVVVKKDPNLTSDQVIAYCRENLTSYKVPKIVEFRTELPKTNVGKVLRRALRDAQQTG